MDWDDYRFFLAIAREGSLTRAGKVLGVSQPTVSRRLAALESKLATRLFDRTRDGYELTSVGMDLMKSVQRVDEDLNQAARKAHGKDRELIGRLRVTCTEILLNDYLAPFIWRFLDQHPGIELSIIGSRSELNLSRSEADLAIRFTRRPLEVLAGRRLASVMYSIYAAANSGRYKADNEDEWDWIRVDDEAFNREISRERLRHKPPKHITGSVAAMCSMVDAGLGVALLPCYVGDRDERLRRVVPELLVDSKRDLWILYHPDIRRVARVRLFADYVTETVIADRELFEGMKPRTE